MAPGLHIEGGEEKCTMIYRVILATALIFCVPNVFADSNFSPDLLSYQQLMELPKPKRIEYLKDLSKLLQEMEQGEASGKYAANESGFQEMKQQIAWMLETFSFLPEADAATKWKRKLAKAPVKAAAKKDVPADQPAEAPAARPAAPFSSHQLFSGTCERPTFACQDLSTAERDKEAAAYRDERGDNSCISGGFFSTYTTRNKRPGTCRIVKEFPPNSRAPAFSCAKNQPTCKGKSCAMCNPWIFCLKTTGHLKNSDGSESERTGEGAAPFCITYNHKTANNITVACEQQYKEALSKEDGGDGKGLSFYVDKDTKKEFELRKCDPGEIDLHGLQEAWNNITDSIKDRYESHCAKNSSFQALFCNECQKMADQIYSMNKKADGTGCASQIKGQPNSIQNRFQDPPTTQDDPEGPAHAVPEQQDSEVIGI